MPCTEGCGAHGATMPGTKLLAAPQNQLGALCGPAPPLQDSLPRARVGTHPVWPLGLLFLAWWPVCDCPHGCWSWRLCQHRTQCPSLSTLWRDMSGHDMSVSWKLCVPPPR